MSERLQKYLATCGIDARRKCEIIISQGRVQVNGKIARTLGTTVDPLKDEVLLDGKLVKPPDKFIYFALNKPRGYVVTMSDSHGMPMVTELLQDVEERIFPVGRLDLDTEGLLILTNDGLLANRMMHPRYSLEKEYIVTVKKELQPRDLRWLRKGIPLNGKITLPAEILIIKKSRKGVRYRVIIHEGRKRQIRRMFKAVGAPVLHLKRGAVGPISLGRLHSGEYRSLSSQEIKKLKKALGLWKKAEKPGRKGMKNGGKQRHPKKN